MSAVPRGCGAYRCGVWWGERAGAGTGAGADIPLAGGTRVSAVGEFCSVGAGLRL